MCKETCSRKEHAKRRSAMNKTRTPFGSHPFLQVGALDSLNSQCGGESLSPPHDDSQLPNGPDKVLLGTSCQRVQDFDAVRSQEFYDSSKFPDSQLWDGGVLENEKDDVAGLDFPIVDPFWLWDKQM